MEKFSKTIENWYAENKRDLPWRHITDPYKIWISEIILQQTQVKQGYNYYLKFIQRFPDVQSLAQADEQEVLKYWQGLGYYSRARNLHAAAVDIMTKRDGQFPILYKEVRSLKGVGDYTAAAICSFAYNQPEAVLDGNVYRVLSRYFGIDTPIDTTQGKHFFTELSRKMLDTTQPALYNQAIMDFGAIQCAPANPGCTSCPLQDSCVAFATSGPGSFPVKARKTKVKDVYYTYLYIRYKHRFLLHKRSGKGIWKNMFELPVIESESAQEQEAVLSSKDFRKWASFWEDNATATISQVVYGLKHVLSHRQIHAQCFLIDLDESIEEENKKSRKISEARNSPVLSQIASGQHCVVAGMNDLQNYPLPRLITLILEEVEKSGQMLL